MKSTPQQLERARKYREAHKDQCRKYSIEYHKKNREKQLKKSRDWYWKNRQKCIDDKRNSRRINPEHHSAICKKYYYKHRESKRASALIYAHKNRERISSKMADYYLKNKSYYKLKNKEWQSKNPDWPKLNYHRRKLDPLFRITTNLKNRTRLAIKYFGARKHSKTKALLGADFQTVKNHLQSLWVDGMSWSNYGRFGWHIDHIRPCASFDLSDPEQQKKCFHYTNLQPLWWQDNFSKGDKYIPT